MEKPNVTLTMIEEYHVSVIQGIAEAFGLINFDSLESKYQADFLVSIDELTKISSDPILLEWTSQALLETYKYTDVIY